MKKAKIKIPNPTCVRCGKEAPIDKSLSNETWTVFKVNETCECGGSFKCKFD